MHAPRFALLMVLALLMTAPRAHAEAGDRATAEALFQAGRDDFLRGDFAAACEKFEESQRLEPTAGTALNLAVCSEKLGKIATAWRYYREAVEKLPDDRRKLAEERMKAIEPTVPHLTIGLERGVSEDARIERNGVEMGRVTLGVALPVDPGKHVIVVKEPGHADRAFELEIASGERKELVVSSVESLPSSPEASNTPQTSGAPSRAPDSDAGSGSGVLTTIGFVVGGIGLAGLATMAVTGVMAMGKQGTVEEHCDGRECDPEGLDAASAGQTFSTIANVSFAVGLAGVGAGIVLILVDGGENETSLRAEATPTGAVMRMRGTF